MEQLQFMGNGNGYPMVFKIKDKVLRKHETEEGMVHAERKFGCGLLDPVKPGDEILFYNQAHKVIEVSDPRPCKGTHNIEGVLFQEVTTHFVDKPGL